MEHDMIIKKKRINSVKNILNQLPPKVSFKIVIPTNKLTKAKITEIGFILPLQNGDTILPKGIGPITKFNSEGKYITRDDLPKERRYIRTIEWSWKQWNGPNKFVTQTADRPIYKECYPRDFIPPTSLELTVATDKEVQFITSETFQTQNSDNKKIHTVINIFLELFGECEIRHSNLNSILPPNIKRLNWQFLPPGTHPWKTLEKHMKAVLKQRKPQAANPIMRRQEKISSYEPTEIYIGQGGFSSYVAYVFKKKNIAILESTLLGNATYIFGKNWQTVSKLSKAEIMNGQLHIERIIHNEKWYKKIKEHLE